MVSSASGRSSCSAMNISAALWAPPMTTARSGRSAVSRDSVDPRHVFRAVDDLLARQAAEHLGHVLVPADRDDQVTALHAVAVGQRRGPALDHAVVGRGAA